MKRIILGLLASVSMVSVSYAEETKSQFNLVEHCKQDCPKAKSDADAHKCAEKIGKLNKEFRKGKCWAQNEKYEASLETSETAH